MKKFILLILVAFFTATTTLAQEATATLNHKDSLTTFYGMDALVSACKNAVNGDVITLSHGQFISPTISKDITIIGSGMDTDTVQGIMPTIIFGETTISTSNCSFKNLYLQGIYPNYHSTPKINFEKCWINSHRNAGSAAHFFLYNCIAYTKSLYKIQAINSFLSIDNGSRNCIDGIYDNCVLKIQNVNSPDCRIEYSTLTNCIIIDNNTDIVAFGPNVYLTNTLYVGAETAPFTGCNIGKAWQVGSDTEIFKTGSKYYELTDEIKEKYKGIDGKELGIYGGAHTFSPYPITHHITRCDVAPKTTPDGKLSVHIEVSGAE